jgi:energy-coupling factor transporter ATP-binding protein EcfA2
MRIVEIGHTGVGKTTFMASMYGFLQKPIEQFSLRTTQISDHQRLLNLAQEIQKGNYPSPTDQRSEYNFYLQYQGKNIFPFTWADYRGGAIQETKSSQQARLLYNDLEEADGILIFCDAQALVNRNIRSNKIGRMTILVSNALRNVDHPVAVTIILTKADLAGQLNEDALVPLSGLIEAIKASEYISSIIIPVACGKEQWNVHIPPLFVLYIGVYLKSIYLKKEMDDYQNMAQFYEEQTYGIGGFLKESWDFLFEGKTDSDRAREQRQKSLSKYKELEVLIEPVQALHKYFYSE